MSEKILVGIHRTYGSRYHPDIEFYKNILEYNNISFVELDISEIDFWSKVQNVTHFIYKWTHTHHDHLVASSLIPIIEYQLKKKCFPNWQTCWHYDDKIKQYYLLKVGGFPVCESYIFYDKVIALKYINNLSYPLVYKLKNGAGSMNVKLVRSYKEAVRLVNKMFGNGVYQTKVKVFDLIKTLNYDFNKILRHYLITLRNNFFQKHRKQFWQKHKNYIFFQKYLGNNLLDTRVTTVGLRVHAFRRFNRPNDFRASGSNIWDINPEKIDMRMVQIALNITKHFGFQSMAYDFLLDENNDPKIVEMSYLYGGAGYPDFMNGYWDENLNWISGRFWPQYFELVDLLNKPDLKMPPDLKPVSDYAKVKI